MISVTKREADVIKLLTEGKTNLEISRILFISVHTVKAILEKIYDKTNCRNRVQVAIWAFKNNIMN